MTDGPARTVPAPAPCAPAPQPCALAPPPACAPQQQLCPGTSHALAARSLLLLVGDVVVRVARESASVVGCHCCRSDAVALWIGSLSSAREQGSSAHIGALSRAGCRLGCPPTSRLGPAAWRDRRWCRAVAADGHRVRPKSRSSSPARWGRYPGDGAMSRWPIRPSRSRPCNNYMPSLSKCLMAKGSTCPPPDRGQSQTWCQMITKKLVSLSTPRSQGWTAGLPNAVPSPCYTSTARRLLGRSSASLRAARATRP